MTKFKAFIQRHAFILVIFVALVVAGTNYLIYPTFIKKQLSLVDVPVAVMKINENEAITPEKVTTISIDPTFLPANIVTDKNKLTGKYIADKCTVFANGFFYEESLADTEKAFGKAYANLKEDEYAFAIELTDAYKQAAIFKVNQSINIYYYEEYENDLGVKSFLVGQLAENVRIVDIVGDEGKSQSFVVIALDEEQYSTFILAEQYGNLVPALNWQSNGLDFKPTEYYNIENLDAHIKEQSKLYTKLSSNDEFVPNETKEESVEKPSTEKQ